MEGLLTQEQSIRLRSSIAQPLPCCTGMVQVSEKDLVIYYGKDENASRLDFLHASDEALGRLAAACEPATFGLNHENVHDESYRKARKLGSEAFSPTLDPIKLGLINIVRDSLLRGSTSQKMVRAELYNLNVYGKNSFFMPHVDTPRGASMFGSLVIFYPTRHEGGDLVVRQGDNEWTFNSTNVLSGSAGPRIGYAAFYGDVEHEVKMVTAGYRVTITYNLYFEHSSEVLPSVLSPHTSAFKAALESLLLDETFLPKGGCLALGLQYSYPLPRTYRFSKSLDPVLKHLKGNDAEVLQVAKELSLQTSLWSLIKVGEYNAQYLCKGQMPEYEGRTFDGNRDSYLMTWLKAQHGAKRLSKHRGGLGVHWITRPSKAIADKQAYATYGNAPALELTYSSVCLFIQIGEPGSRTEFKNSSGSESEADSSYESDAISWFEGDESD